jgi:hypothetical protein
VINDGTLAFGDAKRRSAAYRTPTAQIYTGTLALFSEDNFVTVKSRYDNLGQQPSSCSLSAAR